MVFWYLKGLKSFPKYLPQNQDLREEPQNYIKKVANKKAHEKTCSVKKTLAITSND